MNNNLDKELAEIKGLIDNDYTATPEATRQPRYTPSVAPQNRNKQSGAKQPTKGRKPSKQINIRFCVVIAAAVLLILLIILAFRGCAASDPLQGAWDMDGVTVYRFDGNGEGAMLLPTRTYVFHYSVDTKAKTVSIDFEDERASDYTYMFEVTDSKLILSGKEGKETFRYEFTRMTEDAAS